SSPKDRCTIFGLRLQLEKKSGLGNSFNRFKQDPTSQKDIC
ncbi:uncharacterized protein METZ01_LOCUS104713, partial [marine metagenome]